MRLSMFLWMAFYYLLLSLFFVPVIASLIKQVYQNRMAREFRTN
jgi:hypothetical protein